MENDHSEKNNQPAGSYTFLTDKEASDVFGKLDYELKSGRHIQYQHPDQEAYFRFISRNLESLKKYYEAFFFVNLEMGGISPENYYYLNYETGARTAVPADKRENLDPASMLIGIFVCKIYFIDLHPDISSISTLKNLIMEEYEEYKADFLRLLAHARESEQERFLKEDETELVNAIRAAFRDFEKLGWIFFSDKDKEHFTVLPSMDRLRKLYAQEINTPRKLAEQFGKEV